MTNPEAVPRSAAADGPAEAPPPTAGFAARHGLIRPIQGRYVAGVCAAIGRATNTDPVLWRVLIAVLAFVGGSGLIIYLVGWLLMPQEGDTASPVESLFGRGRSSTSPLRVLLVAIVAAFVFAVAVRNNFPAALLVASLIVAGAVLISRNDRPNGPAAFPPTPAPTPYQTPPPYPADQTTEIRPPFAPRGPYASSQPTYPPTPPVKVPKPKPPKSRLGRVTFFLALLSTGLLAAVDLAGGVDVALPAYAAVVLGIIGLSLVVGTWFGRARGLIALGLVSCLALAGTTVAESVEGIKGGVGDVRWTPGPTEPLQPRYELAIGDSTLDLTGYDFGDRTESVLIKQGIGSMQVLLPTDVDVVITFDVKVGQIRAFDQQWDASANRKQVVTDNGGDGPGGGQLILDVEMKIGNARVTR